MDNRDSIAAAIMAQIAALPIEQQEEAILNLFSVAFGQMSEKDIADVRREIIAAFPTDIPIVAQALDLIDGNLALREIAKL